MEIDADFWPGQRLKNCVQKAGRVGAPCLLFNHWFTWIIDCASREKFPRDDLCGDSANFKEWFDDISPVLSVEISWVVFGSVVKVVAKVVYCVVYRRCWQTKLSWSQVCSWARVTRGICAKHKNAWWVFSAGDFVLESLFCAQRLWI